MVVPVLKTTFMKSKPKRAVYRNYRHFDNQTFRNELKLSLVGGFNCVKKFKSSFLGILNNNAPMKNKVVRANHKEGT